MKQIMRVIGPQLRSVALALTVSVALVRCTTYTLPSAKMSDGELRSCMSDSACAYRLAQADAECRNSENMHEVRSLAGKSGIAGGFMGERCGEPPASRGQVARGSSPEPEERWETTLQPASQRERQVPQKLRERCYLLAKREVAARPSVTSDEPRPQESGVSEFGAAFGAMKTRDKDRVEARQAASRDVGADGKLRQAYWECVRRGGKRKPQPSAASSPKANPQPPAVSTGKPNPLEGAREADRARGDDPSQVWLWELTICEQKPWIRETGPFEGYEACSVWAMTNKKETFGRHCGTEADMGEQWREQSFCP